jgi:hypothetical protein
MSAAELFFEIFQDTSSGDFGVQIGEGPLLRCHTHVITRVHGFAEKVRENGEELPRSSKGEFIPTSVEVFRKAGYHHLMQDTEFSMFSQPMSSSKLQDGSGLLGLNDGADPFGCGFTTASMLAGSHGAYRRSDPFSLAERYRIEGDVEKLVELIRFVYTNHTAFFDLKPRNAQEREMLKGKMLGLLFISDKFSTDGLFAQLVSWFTNRCWGACGAQNYVDAFYQLQHFYHNECREKNFKESLRICLTEHSLCVRGHFRAVTRDSRWSTLPFKFLQQILLSDNLAIGSETEVLNLIERWNAQSDKKKIEIVRLMVAFRPDERSRKDLELSFANLGFDLANMAPKPNMDPEEAETQALVKQVLQGGKTAKPPRRNLNATQLTDAVREAEEDRAEDERQRQEAAKAKLKEEMEQKFIMFHGSKEVASGFSFDLKSGHRIIQATPQRDAGTYRLRVTLMDPSDPHSMLWNPNHEVFVGVSYGNQALFGYMCGISAFQGVFALRTFSLSTSKNTRQGDDDVEIEARNKPVHLTGSGNKVEFDISLEAEMQRINTIVCCKLCIIMNNVSITEDPFQISHETLKKGHGLRFNVLAAGENGIGEDGIEVQLAWVGGGSVEKLVK